ncbi:uncharacterized protein PV09_04605 [Verruconis gallopava]|uniref:Uncharacterized protein n=1 Tax=Verruconis gallopava TaxID=253628 RepID=A0A0D1YUF7_9PEZI|nr:uncharacterized protein PV09_04605 [Verruconis gallopava]KIW04312.1 hypothetical protein PV09_04605 [Verruconis gallopava]
MLNAKELARVLNANLHPQFFSSWLVMSPNATLLAYSGSPNIQQLRDQAALLSQIWREQKAKLGGQSSTSLTDHFSSSASTASTIAEGALETLTIENAKSNIIIRAVQPRLLLVLIGGSPPRRPSNFFKLTAEARGDPRYPPELVSPDSGSAGSAHDSVRGDSPPAEVLTHDHESFVADPPAQSQHRDLSEHEKIEILDLQRRKIDAATEFIRGDFESKKFVMPDEISIP